MKVPLSWLKEYLPTSLSTLQIADKLTAIGLEFEGIHEGVMEIALTPNLIHCANIRGMARELSAVTGGTLLVPHYVVPESKDETTHSQISVSVETSTVCPRYACRLIKGVRVGPSPQWLQKRIEQCGMRSVNNVVDITNLVLLEWGHPLHAFDFDTLEGKQVRVRYAHKGETITTLDGKCHYPTEETLLICDAQKPIAIAGIIGSLHTEVTEATTTVLLEAAYFDPSQIRRTSKRMEIRSEASYRFERGCDPNGVLEALARATAWICEITGGRALEGTIDVHSQEFPMERVHCRLSRINHVLGTHLAMGEVETIFSRLGFLIERSSDDLISVNIPTYRVDIHQEIDLIEEVARLYGYDDIKKGDRPLYRTGTLAHSPEYLFTRAVRERLLNEGLQECLTCDLISPEQAALISKDTFPSRTLIKILNPHSLEQSILRPSLLPGMLSVMRYNEDHGIESVSGFEVGRVHFTVKDQYFEPPVAAVILSGEKTPDHWGSKNLSVDFFDLKGIIENLLAHFKIPKFSLTPSAYANFHPGRQAILMIGEVEAGILGEVHPLTLQKAGVKGPVYYAEVNLQDVQIHIPTTIRMEPLPQYPASSRDWTVTLPEEMPVGKLLEAITKTPSDLLESVTLWGEIYRSPELGAHKKVTFRIVYRDPHKTISQIDVEQEHLRITKNISLQGEPS